MHEDIRQFENFEELVSFIREQIREYKKPVTKQTSIEDDLGVTGEEADELLANFSSKYRVDIRGFDFGKYFNDEPNPFLGRKDILPLTVGHLEKAIMAGRLDEEIINS